MLMTRLSKYTQTPDEDKRYAIEYSDWLDTSEYIEDIEFETTPTTSPPLSVGSTVIAQGDTGVNSLVKFFISGGVDGKNYTLIVTITTSTGQIKQDTVLFQIRDV